MKGIKKKNPLMKRIPRELKKDLGKYIVLFLFLALTIGFVSGFLVADGSMIKTYNDSFSKYNIENGHFITSLKLTDKAIENIEDEDVELCELFYKDKQTDNDRTIRVYKIREEMNLADVMEGCLPEKEGEIVIDRLFAENNALDVGDLMSIEGKQFKVVGMVALSDYSALFKNNSDMMFDATNFSVALVTPQQFKNFSNAGLKYCYAWRYNNQEMTENEQQNKAEDLMNVVYENALLGADISYGAVIWNNLMAGFPGADYEELDITSGEKPLQDFVSRQDNQAIQFTGEDMGSDRVMFQWLLYIIVVVLAFAFAITTRNTIEQEAKTIGTLRASGFTRRELLIHYITLPVIITLAAALAGNILGYTVFKMPMANMYYHSYSLPTYTTIWSADAFFKTTLVPCLLVFAVELLVVGRSLSLSPLQFLRRDLKRHKQSKAVKLPDISFKKRFLIRVLIQNRSTYVLLFAGIFFASFIFLFGSLFTPLLQNFKANVQESKICDYQYILKDQVETDDPDAEKYAVCTLENESGEKITVYGIQGNSRYVDMKNIRETSGNSVILSDGYMDKYGLKEGDEITLKEEFNSDRYAFKVKGEYNYPATLCIFMTLDRFNETFDMESDYFSGYFSDKMLGDIDESDIATVITEKDLTVMANQLEDSMGKVFFMFLLFSIVIFLLMIYLLARLITERNTYAISMLKILGYTNREAGHLYNNATLVMTVISFILSGVLGVAGIKVIYYIMMKAFAGWLTFYVAPWGVPLLVVTGVFCYFLVNFVLMRRIRKIPMADALKDVD
ncbi:MAG: ABC transporter permease [Clostridiales bacterium]|nr:ABC transporter permease [Clostridiales bacterium]